jgi:cytochrome b
MATTEPSDAIAGAAGSRPSARVKVWDAPTRAFHWLLVLLILNAWVSFQYSERVGDLTMKWHRWSGYAVLVLLVFRLIWGMVGSSTSRFASFVRGPFATLGYAFDLVRGRSRHFLGHNPLGTWMILALLLAVFAQAALGLVASEHNDLPGANGPLAGRVSEEAGKLLSRFHRQGFFWVILPLIGAHITANIMYGLVKRDPLIRAMITGHKPRADYEDAAEAQIVDRSLLKAAVCLALAGAIVFGGIWALGGKL